MILGTDRARYRHDRDTERWQTGGRKCRLCGWVKGEPTRSVIAVELRQPTNPVFTGIHQAFRGSGGTGGVDDSSGVFGHRVGVAAGYWRR